jgi:hypothetical protein
LKAPSDHEVIHFLLRFRLWHRNIPDLLLMPTGS